LKKLELVINIPIKIQEKFIKQIQEVIDEQGNTNMGANYLITRARAVIVRIVGRGSEYYHHIEEIFSSNKWSLQYKLSQIMSSLKGLLQDLKSGYLKSLSEIIHDDIFSDFLDMASHLFQEGYKDAAAVIAGSTLEEHLRKLCSKTNIDIEIETPKGIKHKPTDRMNADLAKHQIYTKGEQKQITAWLDIRNNSAHGKYDEYDENQVDLMITGIKDFFVKHPA